jgi:hypothetical protein
VTPDEIMRDAKEMAQHYPGDRLRLTGREILDLVQAQVDALARELDAKSVALRDNAARLNETCAKHQARAEAAEQENARLRGENARIRRLVPTPVSFPAADGYGPALSPAVPVPCAHPDITTSGVCLHCGVDGVDSAAVPVEVAKEEACACSGIVTVDGRGLCLECRGVVP